MEEKKLVPKLRFPGFTEPWEQRKLSDILVERNEQQVETSEYPLMSFVQGIGVTPKGERYDRSFLVLDQSKKYKRTELGDFIYSSNNLETGSIGINKTGKAVISPVYSIFYGVSIGDSEFIGIMSLLPGFIAKMIRFRKGVVYGQWRIHEKDFLDISVSIPSVDERTKITKLILSIEELITLHQRKLEHLKLKKKSLLQKLFPKEGSVYPELRFPGFTDPWEQRKLNDFGIATGGTSIESEFVDGGSYKVISIGSYSEESVYNDQGLRVNKTEKTKSRVLAKDDLTIILNDKTSSGNIIGRVLLIDQDNTYVYNQRTERIEVDTKNFLPMFLYHMLNAPEQRKYIVKASQGNTQIYVNWSTISNINYMIPTLLSEQEKIAYLFSLINKDITLHQRKLEHLQLLKKALLQQLFV